MEEVIFKKPHALTDVPFHYCAGCTHGIIHRLVAEVIDELGCEGNTVGVSELDTFSGMNGILLYLDEIQYFNKKQQQTLLEYLENGSITLIASTTENPIYPFR